MTETRLHRWYHWRNSGRLSPADQRALRNRLYANGYVVIVESDNSGVSFSPYYTGWTSYYRRRNSIVNASIATIRRIAVHRMNDRYNIPAGTARQAFVAGFIDAYREHRKTRAEILERKARSNDA